MPEIHSDCFFPHEVQCFETKILSYNHCNIFCFSYDKGKWVVRVYGSQHQEESFSFVKGQMAHEMCQYLISD